MAFYSVHRIHFILFFSFHVKVRPLKTNDSSIVKKVTREIEAFLTKGQVQEAATLAIALLSSNDNDTVGVTCMLQLHK